MNRSLYKDQLEDYFQFIPKARIKVIVLEDFISDQESIIRELCGFLYLDYEDFPEEVFDIHANKAVVSKSLKLQIQKNALLRGRGNLKYSNDLPFKSTYDIEH
ncbi:hypothetical protein ES692_10710 [Psychroserpens burtonensis]|uniref:Sulfotransferase domain-containing protein n=1 Tax=Psychroserpens burtonensis TaxID=49278 RepID=A0A5C7B5T4_9FLAO|nr:hypothetical protein [Psychroserpens burtonensis]TXE17121.1 hypothetical protein ES692_10710 [Psychroserpens burtonensis]